MTNFLKLVLYAFGARVGGTNVKGDNLWNTWWRRIQQYFFPKSSTSSNRPSASFGSLPLRKFPERKFITRELHQTKYRFRGPLSNNENRRRDDHREIVLYNEYVTNFPNECIARYSPPTSTSFIILIASRHSFFGNAKEEKRLIVRELERRNDSRGLCCHFGHTCLVMWQNTPRPAFL